jgi:hypothetical protein
VPVHGAADEERPHLRDELGGLARRTHRLHHVAQRIELLADEPDHELVVVGVETVAREPHVVSEIGPGVAFPDRTVLAQDAALLAWLEPGERAVPA